jgi:hypothetical protein
VATTAVLLLLSEKPRYPKLGAYPKYGDFTLQWDCSLIPGTTLEGYVLEERI